MKRGLRRRRPVCARYSSGTTTMPSYLLPLSRRVMCTGHDLQRVASGICAGISTSFNATEYLPRCMAEIKHLARDARGLRMQHDDE